MSSPAKSANQHLSGIRTSILQSKENK